MSTRTAAFVSEYLLDVAFLELILELISALGLVLAAGSRQSSSDYRRRGT
jgi:hypothetical protein